MRAFPLSTTGSHSVAQGSFMLFVLQQLPTQNKLLLQGGAMSSHNDKYAYHTYAVAEGMGQLM